MAENVELQAREREGRGKNDARRLRATGFIPAVLYGESKEAGKTTPLAVPDRTVDYTLTHLGDNALYDISLGSNTSTARVVDVQRDAVSGRLVHVDFIPVNMTERIEVTVPLTVEGEAPGVEQDGGVLQQVAYELQVESLPGDIPQEIRVNVSNLQMGDNLTLGDLTLPDGATLVSEPEGIAVTVVAPTEITEEEIEAAGIVEEEAIEGEDEEAAPEDVEEGEEAAAGQPSEQEDE